MTEIIMARSPPPLDYDLVGEDEFEEWEKSDVQEFELIGNVEVLFRLFPLCAEFQFFKDLEVTHGIKPNALLQDIITKGIREIAKEFSKAADTGTALKDWGFNDVFPSLASSQVYQTSNVKFYNYLDQLVEISAIINLCETLHTSLSTARGAKHRYFKYMGHQLAIIFFFLKRTAPTMCEEVDKHFTVFRKVWEDNSLPESEYVWLGTFLSVLLDGLYTLTRSQFVSTVTVETPPSSSSSSSSSSSDGGDVKEDDKPSSSPSSSSSTPSSSTAIVKTSPFINSFQYLLQGITWGEKK